MPALLPATRRAQEMLDRLEHNTLPHAKPRMALIDFLQDAWRIVEPQSLVLERHMYEICDVLEKLTWHMRPQFKPANLAADELIQETVINVPPGFSKSLITCVIWPAWCWTIDPTIKFIFASFDADLTMRDAERTQNILTSTWYVSRWGQMRHPGQTWRKRLFKNKFGGNRLSTSIGGKVLGNHADARIIDDPTKPQALLGGKESVHEVLDKAIKFLSTTLATRMTDPKKSVTVIIMQRLHQGDLAGHVLKEVESDPERQKKFRWVRLPMRFNAEYEQKPYELRDWRTKEGELLAPKRYDAEEVARLVKELGDLATVAAQLDQDPIAEGGNLFKVADFRRYSGFPPGYEKNQGRLIQSWDLRFKDDASSGDYVAGQVWWKHKADYYLIDEVHARLGFTETENAILDLTNRYPKARTKLVENKANGPAIHNRLKSVIGGIVLVEPDGGKIARAHAISALVAGGNVYIPEGPAWAKEWLDEVKAFPKARFDDRVDAFTQALNHLDDKKKNGYSGWLSSLK